MISGGFNKGQMPIPLYISDYRRKMIIQSMIGESASDKDKAKKIAQVSRKFGITIGVCETNEFETGE